LNVAVVHGESQPATVAALTARALTRVPVVYDAHGVGPEEVELDGVSRGVPRKRVVAEVSLAREWERRCWWASDAVVAVSSALVRHLTETYGPRDRAIVIPCATDAFPTSDRSCRSAVRKELGVADRDVFTYVGSLAPYQLAPDTLRWFAQVRQRRPSAFLLVVSQASRDAWDRLAREAGVPDHAYRVVAAPHHQVPDYVAAADVGLMLRAESAVNRVAFPTKLAEYLAAGVPVVTTDALHDPAKLVKDHRLGLVLPAGAVPDVDAIERFILVVREDREGWFRRCRGVAADLLTWPRYADRLLAAYAAALSKAQPDHRWFDGFVASSPARAEDGG
jgi:glycosyltransferase involved in cell wall biosynthesis